MIQNLCGPFMSQNILKRREEMDRDLLWHTHCVTKRMVCKAYESVQMCKFYNFQNMTQFFWGGGREGEEKFQFCVWVDKKFLQMYNLIREAYTDKATCGCSNHLQYFSYAKSWTQNSSAFCTQSVLRAHTTTSFCPCLPYIHVHAWTLKFTHLLLSGGAKLEPQSGFGGEGSLF